MGALGDFFAWLDNKKRVAGRQIADLATRPNDFGEMQASRFDQGMRERLQDPTAALDFVTGSVGGLAGIIRPRGLPNLNMVHNIPSEKGFLRLLEGRRSISNPSIAIAKDQVFPFEQQATLVMNPNSPLFDPAQHRGNQLFNRDAYTFRGRSPREIPRDLRLEGQDFRNTEGIEVNSPSQNFAMHASPQFRSFAEYESSPYGARNLLGGSLRPDDKLFSNAVWERAKRWANDKFMSQMQNGQPNHWHPSNNPDFMVDALQAAKRGDIEASYILQAARQIPSEYGELKVLGEVPLNPRNVSAVMFPHFYPQSTVDDFGDYVSRNIGVPAGRPKDLLPPAYAPFYDNLTKQIAHEVREQANNNLPFDQAYNSLPELSRKYIDDNTFDTAIQDPRYIDEIIRYQMDTSPAFAADVASMYTARKP